MKHLLLVMILSPQDFISAVAAGDTVKVREMLEKEPSLIDSKDGNGVSALLTAVFRSRKSMVELLLSQRKELDIFEAASVGDTERVRQLVAGSPELVNAYAPYGFFPLGLATFFGHLETVKALLASGADVNLQSRETMKVSALHSATAAGRLDIARLLLEAHADPNAKAAQDFRPLHEAAARGHMEFAAALLSAGADINARTADGKTPLAFAVEHQKEEMAEFLRARGGG
jgi:ankyrin repeat protein